MSQPEIIVFSSSNVDDVPMLSDNNIFTGQNSFTSNVSVTASFYVNTINVVSVASIKAANLSTIAVTSLASISRVETGQFFGNTFNLTSIASVSGHLSVNTLLVASTASLSLGDYVPYTGATTDVDLGGNGILADYMTIGTNGASGIDMYNNSYFSFYSDAGETYLGRLKSSGVGLFDFQNEGNGIIGILNFASLASPNKTFTFPNVSGTFALIGAQNIFSGDNSFTSTVSLTGSAYLSGTTRLGGTANYIQIDGSGELSLEGTATRWDDERVPITSTKVPASKNPGFTIFKNDGGSSQGVFTYWFDKDSEEELYFTLQVPHTYKEGSNVFPHVHWCPKTTASAASETVCWGLEYTWANTATVFSNTTIVYANTSSPNETLVANKHYMTSFPTIVGTGKTISSMFVARIFRDATSAGLNDGYNDDAGLLEIDFHYEKDSMGSKTETAK